MRFTLLFLIIFCFILNGSISQEQKLDSLAKLVDQSYGVQKLHNINLISKHYMNSEEKERFKYGKQGVILAENLLETRDSSINLSIKPFVEAFFYAGKNDYDKEIYFNARSKFQQVISLNKEFGKKFFFQKSKTYLDSIQAMIDRKEIKDIKIFNTLNNLKIGKLIKDASLDTKIQSEIKKGKTKEGMGNILGAIKNYKSAINLSKNKGDYSGINELQIRISELLATVDQEKEAQDFLQKAIEETEAEANEKNPIPTNDTLTNSLKALRYLADSLAQANDQEGSALYYELYNELTKRIAEDSIRAVNLAEQKRREILLLKQQKQIADLKVASTESEKEKRIKQRNTVFIIACIILLATLLTLYFYFAKNKEHKKLNETYKDLEQTKNELEEAEKKIVTLLKQQVSEDIADELLVNSNEPTAERHFVCVLFLDIRNFTVRAEKLSPEELIDFQNQIFGFMIDLILEYNGNINQLLGDGFMATFGAPRSHGNDCQNAFDAARSILLKLKEKIEKKQLPKVRIGMGLHAGNIVSGNVGSENRMQYSITGNPVIIASRIEQLNKEFHSQLILSKEVYQELSKQTKEEIGDNFQTVTLKGRSEPTDILIVSK